MGSEQKVWRWHVGFGTHAKPQTETDNVVQVIILAGPAVASLLKTHGQTQSFVGGTSPHGKRRLFVGGNVMVIWQIGDNR